MVAMSKETAEYIMAENAKLLELQRLRGNVVDLARNLRDKADTEDESGAIEDLLDGVDALVEFEAKNGG